MSSRLAACVVGLVALHVRTARADDTVVLYVDHVETAQRVKACVERSERGCTEQSLWSSNSKVVAVGNAGGQRNITIEQCMMLWRACEGEPGNIVQKSATIAPASVMKLMSDELAKLTKTLETKFTESLKLQEGRFAQMMRKLGLDEPKPAAPPAVKK